MTENRKGNIKWRCVRRRSFFLPGSDREYTETCYVCRYAAEEETGEDEND